MSCPHLIGLIMFRQSVTQLQQRGTDRRHAHKDKREPHHQRDLEGLLLKGRRKVGGKIASGGSGNRSGESMERPHVAVTIRESRFIFVTRTFVKQMGFPGLCVGCSGYKRNPISQVQSSQLALLFLLFCFLVF
ncbi:hypothetical protein I3760_15G145300 [Carya illinoinensis]|nr:uncharacterized protein LOC122295431 [Carya illinoinensis]KAG2668124.1 hypothetical protein I3760_15G145300 [Carya illinoinensis]KAG2668125.1 hypothetical protein I3760_15G145300 [Carya illinoinensis]KAG6676322.1 hypothetical protein I3842_15G145900 [Carya illinoinensis]KAG6676323.1 hypothetical protein I3842_15G145900 [Carya illinoinensis]